MVDTGSIKVGSFIGDHTKFGIGTLLNTGIQHRHLLQPSAAG